MSFVDKLRDKLNCNQFVDLLESLNLPSVKELIKSPEVNDLVAITVSIFYRCTQLFYTRMNATVNEDQQRILDEIIYESSRILRNSCALGESIQNQIVTVPIESAAAADGNLFHAIVCILRDIPKAPEPHLSQRSRKMCWQFVANLSVQNDCTQQRIWAECKETILSHMQCVCESGNSRECTMILYNIFIGDHIIHQAESVQILDFILECHTNTSIAHDTEHNDFHHIFMEHSIIRYRNIVPIYDKLRDEKRLIFLYYIADHMKAPQNEPINPSLLQFISKEFKKKSDCILKMVTSYVDTIKPKEVIALLDVIAQASSDERYTHVLAGDGALFLNVGCLLQTINTIGKRTTDDSGSDGSSNIFAPIQKLSQLAPNSEEDSNIEQQISYQLKSTLVRTLANLAYKNKKNQDLAREMDIIMAVLDSTNLDARNPLLKEWSILAIRNLCENNEENQQIIRQLTKVGDATNSDILKEFNIDLGSLRINPN